MIEGLSYEELVLIQEIMRHLETNGIYFEYDIEVFESLYRKVMSS